MSDSDSDFAYESAGEDAELECNAANVERSEAKSGTSICENAASTEKQSLTSKSDSVKDQLEEVKQEVESLTLSKENAGDSQDGIQCLENTSQLRKSSVSETSEGNEIFNKDVNLVSQETEPKRVKLRLEKKLMEKSQSASNKTSDAVSNKSSDAAVNNTSVLASDKNVDISSCTLLENAPEQTSPSLSWGWGSWGTSLLSSAASSVTTFTSQVSQGIGTVLETVETTLGAPPPEELAASLGQKETPDSIDKAPEEDAAETGAEVPKEEEPDNSKPATASLFSGVTSLTKVIENTGTKVIMGGLDTLELIGKKTIDILTEGDPGLRKKRAALSDGMTLSQVLRVAQNKAEEERQSSEDDEIQEGVLYTKVFDDYQGLVHLEALEMLSKQCQSKVQTIMNAVSSDETKKAVLDEIKDICEDLPSSDDTSSEECQDFLFRVSVLMEELDLPLNSAEKLEQVHSAAFEVIHGFREKDDITDVQLAKEMHRHAICYLANFTAKCVEHFHKLGELILVQPEIEQRIIHCALKLNDLACTLSAETGCLSSGFCSCLNAIADVSEDHDSVTPLITGVYLEASNSTTYIQDAFQLLIPVLQLASLQ